MVENPPISIRLFFSSVFKTDNRPEVCRLLQCPKNVIKKKRGRGFFIRINDTIGSYRRIVQLLYTIAQFWILVLVLDFSVSGL
jgi:hypothetical protein